MKVVSTFVTGYLILIAAFIVLRLTSAFPYGLYFNLRVLSRSFTFLCMFLTLVSFFEGNINGLVRPDALSLINVLG